jgi:hypothetical protein
MAPNSLTSQRGINRIVFIALRAGGDLRQLPLALATWLGRIWHPGIMHVPCFLDSAAFSLLIIPRKRYQHFLFMFYYGAASS